MLECSIAFLFPFNGFFSKSGEKNQPMKFFVPCYLFRQKARKLRIKKQFSIDFFLLAFLFFFFSFKSLKVIISFSSSSSFSFFTFHNKSKVNQKSKQSKIPTCNKSFIQQIVYKKENRGLWWKNLWLKEEKNFERWRRKRKINDKGRKDKWKRITQNRYWLICFNNVWTIFFKKSIKIKRNLISWLIWIELNWRPLFVEWSGVYLSLKHLLFFPKIHYFFCYFNCFL